MSLEQNIFVAMKIKVANSFKLELCPFPRFFNLGEDVVTFLPIEPFLFLVLKLRWRNWLKGYNLGKILALFMAPDFTPNTGGILKVDWFLMMFPQLRKNQDGMEIGKIGNDNRGTLVNYVDKISLSNRLSCEKSLQSYRKFSSCPRNLDFQSRGA